MDENDTNKSSSLWIHSTGIVAVMALATILAETVNLLLCSYQHHNLLEVFYSDVVSLVLSIPVSLASLLWIVFTSPGEFISTSPEFFLFNVGPLVSLFGVILSVRGLKHRQLKGRFITLYLFVFALQFFCALQLTSIEHWHLPEWAP